MLHNVNEICINIDTVYIGSKGQYCLQRHEKVLGCTRDSSSKM